MDEVDVGILRSMGMQPFATWPHGPDDLKPSVIAGRVGVSVDAVRERIARLEKRGVIRGYEITPNYRLLGQEVTSFRFRLPERGRRAGLLDDAERVDGVCSIIGFLTPDACIDIAHRTPEELNRRVQVLGRLMGDASPNNWFEYRLPRLGGAPSPLDWRIVQALRGRARRSLEEVAKELGVSAKTIKRRFDRMVTEGAFDVTAEVNPGELTGQILFLLLLHLRPGLAEREVQAALRPYRERWFFAGTPPGAANRSFYVALLARSVGDADALAREAESMPGVDRAEALVPVHIKANTAWIDEAIAQRVAATQDSTAAGVVARAREGRR